MCVFLGFDCKKIWIVTPTYRVMLGAQLENRISISLACGCCFRMQRRHANENKTNSSNNTSNIIRVKRRECKQTTTTTKKLFTATTATIYSKATKIDESVKLVCHFVCRSINFHVEHNGFGHAFKWPNYHNVTISTELERLNMNRKTVLYFMIFPGTEKLSASAKLHQYPLSFVPWVINSVGYTAH